MYDYTDSSRNTQPISEETMQRVYEVIALLGDADPSLGSMFTPDTVAHWGVNCLALLLEQMADVDPTRIMGTAWIMSGGRWTDDVEGEL